ncbi:right-handed parallel beta-helix repeat-containing protein [Candidatus Woesearchaeota archaeon]|nr:right-handed parallel beta-helix repeat-containing protein [Nanoarchaeota archaeon]MCB9370174.1 right-handed parallel beta-helix repeat-containing protein [Candidatus Woesearchaeota archaeon]USN44704.1 MAG: right-handed parallel beta-helix repeat-containing protein [Candidatus Woesearchaeota archaeon]
MVKQQLWLVVILFATSFSLAYAQTLDSCGELTEEGSYELSTDVIANGSCMDIKGDNILIDCQGHTLSGTEDLDFGLRLYKNENVTVRNCIIDGFKRNVYVYGAKNAQILDSAFLNAKNGISSTSSSEQIYYENITILNSSDDAFVLSSSSQNVLKNISIRNSQGKALEIMGSENFVEGLFIEGSEDHALYLGTSAANSKIGTVSFKDTQKDAVYVSKAKNVSFSNLHFETGIGAHSLTVKEAENISISESKFSGSSKGIDITKTTLLRFVRNEVSEEFSIEESTQSIFADEEQGFLLGNYWQNFSCILSQERGEFFVCLSPAQYKIMGSEDFVDVAPLVKGTSSEENETVQNETGEENSTLESCQVLDKEGQIYVLSQDIQAQNSCIEILADNISLDCQGYEIRGNAEGIGIRVNEASGINIENCLVRDFETGLLFENSSENELFDVKTTNNRKHGFEASFFSYSTITDLEAFENGEDGIHLEHAYDNSFFGLFSQNNDDDAVHVQESEYNVFSDLKLFFNDDDGVYLLKSEYNTISNATIHANGTRYTTDWGVFLRESDENVFENIHILQAGAGFVLSKSSGNRFIGSEAKAVTGYKKLENAEVYLYNGSENNVFIANLFSSPQAVQSENWFTNIAQFFGDLLGLELGNNWENLKGNCLSVSEQGGFYICTSPSEVVIDEEADITDKVPLVPQD